MVADEPTAVTESARPCIRIQGAAKSFDGRTVVDVPDLTLGTHPIEGLIGPNGAGKTTLMRMVMHSIALDRGKVTFHCSGGNGGVTLSDKTPNKVATLGVVKTNQVIQDFDKLTIFDSLLLAVAKRRDERWFRVFGDRRLYREHADEIRFYLDYFRFEDPMGHAKSAGDKKLLDIIRCLLLKPKVLLLDEPTAGLPQGQRDKMMALIKDKAATEGVSVVVVEHDLNVIWNLSDSVHFMAEGSVILQGDPQWIRAHETVVEKYLGKGHVGG